MPRFFVKKADIEEGRIFIRENDAHHIARSLRMAVGDEVTVCDGEGAEYLCTLEKIRDELCECRIQSQGKGRGEPPYSLTLFMAYPKGDKLEVVIQKAVELGATRIVPFESSRCIKRPDAKRAEGRLDRLMRIAEEAAKQCGRAALPKIELPVSFRQMLKDASSHQLPLFCYEGERALSIRKALEGYEGIPESICAVVGSEGGFSPEEAEEAVLSGLVTVGLGDRILRCETAPDSILSAISYRFEL